MSGDGCPEPPQECQWCKRSRLPKEQCVERGQSAVSGPAAMDPTGAARERRALEQDQPGAVGGPLDGGVQQPAPLRQRHPVQPHPGRQPARALAFSRHGVRGRSGRRGRRGRRPLVLLLSFEGLGPERPDGS